MRGYFLFLIIVFSLRCTLSFSQGIEPLHDIVELHDGSVFVGKIIEESDYSISFVNSIVDTVIIEKYHIAAIERDTRAYSISSNKVTKTSRYKIKRFHKTTGYFAFLDIGFVFDQAPPRVNLVLGKRIRPNLSIGIRGGYESTVTSDFLWREDNFLTAGGYIRYYPWDNFIKPFASFSMGYGFVRDQFNREKSGGMNYEPCFGIQIPTRHQFKLLFSIGQSFQKTHGNNSFQPEVFQNVEVNYDVWLTRTMVKVGVEF